MSLANYTSLSDFTINDENEYSVNAVTIASWGLPSVPLNDLNLNRLAPIIGTPSSYPALNRIPVLDRFHRGFVWQSGDNETSEWWPQGLTNNTDSNGAEYLNGRKWILASWYDDTSSPSKGVRVSIVDVESSLWNTPRPYRHMLLVEPDTSGVYASFKAIQIHAGGIGWYKNFLYVVDTNAGLRVFNLDLIKEVDGSLDTIIGRYSAGRYGAYGYRYILPQVSRYSYPGSVFNWSYCGIDRSNTLQHELVVGNYSTAVDATKLAWFNLDSTTGKLSGTGSINPVSARITTGSERYVQGVLSRRGSEKVWLAASAGDYLWRRGLVSSTLDFELTPWADQPEGLTLDASNSVWNLTERINSRVVFAVKLSDI